MQTKNLQIYSQYNNLTKRQKHERTESFFSDWSFPKNNEIAKRMKRAGNTQLQLACKPGEITEELGL